jgi:hypothetical protein
MAFSFISCEYGVLASMDYDVTFMRIASVQCALSRPLKVYAECSHDM